MKLALIFLIVICFVACKKDSGNSIIPPADTPTILRAHSWYPDQIHISRTDSTTLFTYDSLGNAHTQTVVTNWDTTFATSQCEQQSTYTFLQGDTLDINYQCTQQNLILTWSIDQVNVLTLPPMPYFIAGPVTYSIGGKGLISQLSSSKFTYNNQQDAASIYEYAFGPNYNRTTQEDKITDSVYTTFKSK